MARLLLNQGAYHGERMDFAAAESAILNAARQHGWTVESRLWKQGAPEMHFLRRTGTGTRKLYLSAGIHGDEPASMLAALALLEANRWPADAHLYLCPCLNPEGCLRTTRENADGIDINRDYRHFRTREAAAHVAWLEEKVPFDLALCLHEDWEAHGFYLYELNHTGLPSLAGEMIRAAAEIVPVDVSAEIDGRESNGAGIIRPLIDPSTRPEWPEALWLLTHHGKRGYTLEAPSDWPLQTRVQALVAAVHAGLAAWR